MHGQIVVRTCQSGSLKCHKFHDVRKVAGKTRRNDCEQSRRGDQTQNRRVKRVQRPAKTKKIRKGIGKVVADRNSKTSMVMFQCAWKLMMDELEK